MADLEHELVARDPPPRIHPTLLALEFRAATQRALQHWLRDLLGLFAIADEDAEFVLSLLAVPHRPLPANRDGDANFAGVGSGRYIALITGEVESNRNGRSDSDDVVLYCWGIVSTTSQP